MTDEEHLDFAQYLRDLERLAVELDEVERGGGDPKTVNTIRHIMDLLRAAIYHEADDDKAAMGISPDPPPGFTHSPEMTRRLAEAGEGD